MKRGVRDVPHVSVGVSKTANLGWEAARHPSDESVRIATWRLLDKQWS